MRRHHPDHQTSGNQRPHGFHGKIHLNTLPQELFKGHSLFPHGISQQGVRVVPVRAGAPATAAILFPHRSSHRVSSL